MRICLGAWHQCPFQFLGVDDIKFSPPYDKVCEWNCVGYVLVFVPRINGKSTRVPVDEAINYPDGILITEKPEFIAVYMGDELNANHVIYGLVGKF